MFCRPSVSFYDSLTCLLLVACSETAESPRWQDSCGRIGQVELNYVVTLTRAARLEPQAGQYVFLRSVCVLSGNSELNSQLRDT
jgi:hypothetical protein